MFSFKVIQRQPTIHRTSETHRNSNQTPRFLVELRTLLPVVGGHILPDLERSPERARTQVPCAVPGPLRYVIIVKII